MNNIWFLSPPFWKNEKGRNFIKNFEQRFGYKPDAEAACAYDAAEMMIRAVRQAGLDPDVMQKTILAMDYTGGITGDIRFDKYGNRMGPVFPYMLKQGF